MTTKTRAELDAELRELNKAVNKATSARKEWMDAHMADYARFKIGDVIYNRATGEWMGVVSRHYRVHGRDQRFDSSMGIEYEFETARNCFDNTSRLGYVNFVTAQQMLDSGDYRANSKGLWESRVANPETVESREKMFSRIFSGRMVVMAT